MNEKFHYEMAMELSKDTRYTLHGEMITNHPHKFDKDQ